MKVYIVTSGCYSDYTIEAVFLDKHEAELYIATKTAELSSPWQWDEYNEIEEYDTGDGKISVANRKIGHFSWIDVTWSWSLLEHQIMFEDDARKKSQQLHEKGAVCVWLPEKNEAKAKKILQDRLAELKAKKAGIT